MHNPMHNQGVIYGYARVSTTGQNLAQQLAPLDAAGCTKVYREKVNAATADRPQLKRAIVALAVGDVLMVTATDRLARNTRDLLKEAVPASARSQSQWWTRRCSLPRLSSPCWES